MRITLVLPGYSKAPIGGFKMVFEYANRFVTRGHKVSIVFDCSGGAKHHQEIPVFFRRLCYKFLVWYYPKWFALNPKVHKICAYTGINDQELPDADFVCATAVGTADEVAKLSINKREKTIFYTEL